MERRAAPHGWEWLARGRVKRPGCVIRSWTGGRRVPAVRGPSPTLDTPEVPITLKPRKCTSLRCAPARGAAEAERRQGPASGLSWELGAAGHTSVTLSRPQTRAAREALEMPRSTLTLVGLLPPLQCSSPNGVGGRQPRVNVQQVGWQAKNSGFFMPCPERGKNALSSPAAPPVARGRCLRRCSARAALSRASAPTGPTQIFVGARRWCLAR